MLMLMMTEEKRGLFGISRYLQVIDL